MKIKWYEYRCERTKELVWWTQRSKNTNCFEIRKAPGKNEFNFFINEIWKAKFNDLIEAQKTASEIWAD